ncbi:hypothetical protein IAI18_20805 [Acetobacteraceae bacterium H6797]|nr:hypothetical protein [Acetobacteraceae bacterium H6797]
MRTIGRLFCALVFTAMPVGIAFGQGGSGPSQTPSSPVQPSQPGPRPPSGQTPPERMEQPGVIRPPAQVDPGIHTTVPDPSPNTTPVIPPPGSDGSTGPTNPVPQSR